MEFVVLLVCADENIRAEYFSEVGWAEVETFCAPSDIYGQLEKLVSMMRRDVEQLERGKVEFLKRQANSSVSIQKWEMGIKVRMASEVQMIDILVCSYGCCARWGCWWMNVALRPS